MAKRIHYRINQNIIAPKLRVIDEKGKQLGILEKEKALLAARERKLDLVEIVPKASPPVAKILNFRKFFEEKKKEQRKRSEQKEIRIRPNIGNFDLEVKLKRARKFLTDKNAVKVTCIFRGRENAHPEVGREKILRIITDLSELGKPEGEILPRGKTLEVTLKPG